MPTSPVVDLDGLTVTCGDVTAVPDLTCHAQRGELVALLGADGAGTTSGRDVIGGRRRAISGTIIVSGGTRSVGGLPVRARPRQTRALLEAATASSPTSAAASSSPRQVGSGGDDDTSATDLDTVLTNLDLRDVVLVGSSTGTGAHVLPRLVQPRPERTPMTDGRRPACRSSPTVGAPGSTDGGTPDLCGSWC